MLRRSRSGHFICLDTLFHPIFIKVNIMLMTSTDVEFYPFIISKMVSGFKPHATSALGRGNTL
jgi:uncharacterized membrane protein